MATPRKTGPKGSAGSTKATPGGVAAAALAPAHQALEDLLACLADDAPVPPEVLHTIAEAYERFKYTRPTGGWSAADDPVPTNLGQAFGVPDADGRQSRIRRLRADYTARVAHAFDALGVGRGLAGRRAVAEALGLTEKQVREIMPRVRKWTRGHKSQRTGSSPTIGAHNWFTSR